MKLRLCSARQPAAAWHWRAAPARLVALACAAALGGCVDSYVGSRAFVVQGKHDSKTCEELATLHKKTAKRVAELDELQARAERSAGGSVIGAAVYGPTASEARAELRMVREAQAGNKCPP